MAEVLGHLVAVGIGAAISSVATAICIALLGSGKALENTLAFTLGYAAVLAAIALVAFVFFGTGAGSVERSSEVRDTIDAAIGVLLLVFALKAYLKSPDPNSSPPKWVVALDSVTPTKALLVGTIVILTNPTTLALYVSGLKEIVATDLGVVGSVVVLALFVALVEVEFLVPIALLCSGASPPCEGFAKNGTTVAGGPQPGRHDSRVRDLRRAAGGQGSIGPSLG
ncbi:MAG: GAP family protein [Actinomycetota bacterium]|nr:GAP family protein [Actinomycetota bacterium]